MNRLGIYKIAAILKHGDRNYEYSGITGAVRKKDKITVVCPEHGGWVTSFDTHVSGARCPSCSGQYQTLKQRIIAARKVHGCKYDYSLWPEGITAYTEVMTGCPHHGFFKHMVNNHINSGSGCPGCFGTPRKDKHRRVSEAKKVHGDKYDYSLWPEIMHARTIVTSLCPDHGTWSHNIDNHVRGKGCPKCSVYGYDVKKAGYLYFLLGENGNIKVGVSNAIETRLKQLVKATPFDFEVMAVYKGEDKT